MFPGERPLSLLLRACHLMAVAWLCAGLMGAPGVAGSTHPALAVLASGAALLSLDLAAGRVRLSELAGGVVLLKLALVAGGLLWPAGALPLFWLLMLVSALSAHAPKRVRHRRWWGPRGSTQEVPGRGF